MKELRQTANQLGKSTITWLLLGDKVCLRTWMALHSMGSWVLILLELCSLETRPSSFHFEKDEHVVGPQLLMIHLHTFDHSFRQSKIQSAV